MQTTQGNFELAVLNVQSFLDESASALNGAVAQALRQQLDDVGTALATHRNNQSGNLLLAKGATQTKLAAQVTLVRKHMTAISRIARLDLTITPELRPLLMPAGTPSMVNLAAAASAMADLAAKYSDTFITAGLPSDFIAQLRACTDVMLQSAVARKQHQAKRKGATTGIGKTVTRGRAVINAIDSFVRDALKDNPSLLSTWEGVKHATRSPSTKPAKTPTPAPMASAQATTPATATTVAEPVATSTAAAV